MSTEQLLRLFPEDVNQQSISEAIKKSKSAENYGASVLDLRPDKGSANPRFQDVNYISVGLIDERITSFHVEYVGPEWKTVNQFVAKLSEGLRLPSSSWEGGGQSSQLRCDGFRIDAYAGGSTQSWVRVLDTSTLQVVEDRREAAREKVRQAFKP